MFLYIYIYMYMYVLLHPHLHIHIHIHMHVHKTFAGLDGSPVGARKPQKLKKRTPPYGLDKHDTRWALPNV